MKSIRILATGPEEARLLTELERKNIVVFGLAKHRAMLPEFTAAQLRKLVPKLAAKGWLLPIEAGKYMVVPRAARGTWQENPLVIASGIAPEAHYISYWSALAFHDLTEQLPRSVYVVLREERKRPVVFQGWRYQFVRRTVTSFFGFRSHELRALNGAGLVEVPIADPEKAILDSLDDELLAGGMAEIIKAVGRGLAAGLFEPTRFIDYARRYPNAVVVARLGYILARLGLDQVQELQSLVRRRGQVPPLSTKTRLRSEDAPIDRDWYLRINVPDVFFDVAMIP